MPKQDFLPSADNATGKFVIFRESLDEFLAQVTDLGATNRLAWAKRPIEAIHYTSPDEAVEEAKRIVSNMGYPLSICEVHVQGNQARLRFIIEFKPNTKGH